MARKKPITISRKPTAETIIRFDSIPPLHRDSFQAQPLNSSPVKSSQSINPLGKAVYGTVYCLSYGVVFGALIIGSLIPGSALIGRALQEGAEAASKDFKRPKQADSDRIVVDSLA